MAITQVRVKLGDEWTRLSYNGTTGRWEGEITAPGTSVHQPGGYFPLTAEVTNGTGQTDTVSGEQYSGLRLVVRETAAPTLTLISPHPGYLTTGTPAFVLEAVDEEGGSGVNPESFAPKPSGAEAIPGGYRFTWKPEGVWADGSHSVTFSVRDYDGNESAVSGAYLVDTVPPELRMTLPELHRVVDWQEAEVAGYVRDVTSGVAGVTVAGKSVPLSAGGKFSAMVPLEVGVNNIAISVTDKAGLRTTETVWMLRLITDRTQEDVDAVTALFGRSWENFSDQEKAFWSGVVRGAYNAEDLNRVGIAVEYLTKMLQERGYAPSTRPKTDWTESDAPVQPELATYLANVAAIRAQLPVSAPPVPPDMAGFTFGEANDIEANLVETDRFFPLMERSAIYSGEAFAGEF